MANLILSQLLPNLTGLTPIPFVNPQEYDGLEYRWRFFVFRPQLLKDNLRIEPYLFVGVLLYVAWFSVGVSISSSRAKKWFNAHLPLLEREFSHATTAGLTQDGYSDFYNYSTGRRSVDRLHTTFVMRPRHDLGQLAFQTAWTFVDLRYRPRDEVELEFALDPALTVPEFVWAIVAKDELPTIKEKNWDLTFTRTTDNVALPPSVSIMAEYADVTESIFKLSDKSSLSKILSDPAVLSYFRFLKISDQPRERPSRPPGPGPRSKTLILGLTLPPPAAAASTLPLLSACFALIDHILPRLALRPETRTKVRKTREELERSIREEEGKEKREEKEEERKAAKKKEEERKINMLSAAEQKKALERERKRNLRKSQGKVVRK